MGAFITLTLSAVETGFSRYMLPPLLPEDPKSAAQARPKPNGSLENN